MSPPRIAESILATLVADPASRAELLGNLTEEWADYAIRHGERPANMWYWREAARTIPHLLRERWQAPPSGRGARGRGWFGLSWLDITLGVRMLAKHPALTLVAAISMGVAIAIGAAGSTAISLISATALPLSEGDKIVGIHLWDVAGGHPERRILHDVADWRQMRTLQDVGVFRGTARNIVTPDGRAEVVRSVEMSAAGFRVARVRPHLGRYLIDDDERSGAPLVVVLGYNVWRTRFAADSGIVGRTIRFGPDAHTVVGVMPEGFAFPVNYDLWVPPRINSLDYQRLEGPPLFAFARLAPTATLDEAQAEGDVFAAHNAAAFPATHKTLRPRVLPFSQSWFEFDNADVRQIFGTVPVILVLLLIGISINVAILVYARTATRQSEIAVRSALGASRTRIVTQLFGEALVLSALGGAVGFAIVGAINSRVNLLLAQFGDGFIPFWLHFEVSGATLWYILAFALLGAVIIGVVPGLQLTGRRVQRDLQRLAGGNSSARMGSLWTALVVAEVAVTVALLPPAMRFASEWVGIATTGPGFAAEQYLSASLSREWTQPGPATPEDIRAFQTRFADSRAELLHRLANDPAVRAATLTSSVPGAYEPRRIEIDSSAQSGSHAESARTATGVSDGYPRVGFARVDDAYFGAFGMSSVTGRLFGPADEGTNAVIVNRSFADSQFNGGSAPGRRVRTIAFDGNEQRPGPWMEIVGVVDDVPIRPAFDSPRGAIYVRASHASSPTTLVLRTHADPLAFASRLRTVAFQVDPALLVRDVAPLDAKMREIHLPLQLIAFGLATITLTVLILAAAGIYALMSVTVTQRRREIGIRMALGAGARTVLSGIFRRASIQVGTGIVVGIVLAVSMDVLTDGSLLGGRSVVFLPAVCLFTLAVGTLAALSPARRALSIQPTTVLKGD